MKAIDEINRLVKKAYIDYFKPYGNPSYDEITPSMARQGIRKRQDLDFIRNGMKRNATYGRQLPSGTVGSSYRTNYVQSKGAPVSTVANSQIKPYRAWEDPAWIAEQAKRQGVNPSKTTSGQLMAGTQSAQMQKNINTTLTPQMAYKEIMRRRPGMNPEQARRLSAMVAKNYKLDANGNYVAIGGNANRTNSMIANRFRAGYPSSNMAGSAPKQTPFAAVKQKTPAPVNLNAGFNG